MRSAEISINDGDPLDGMISVTEPSSHGLGHWECVLSEEVDRNLIGQSVTVRVTVGGVTRSGVALVTRIGSAGTRLLGSGPFEVST
jgi:hypothetical protein